MYDPVPEYGEGAFLYTVVVGWPEEPPLTHVTQPYPAKQAQQQHKRIKITGITTSAHKFPIFPPMQLQLLPPMQKPELLVVE